MASSYDSTNRYGALVGDGIGGNQVSYALPAPKSGTNQMIVVMKNWHNRTFASDYSDTALAHSASCYNALSFTGNHITTSDSSNSEYLNLFGSALQDGAANFDDLEMKYASGSGTVVSYILGGASVTAAAALSAYSTPIDASLGGASSFDYPFAIPSNSAEGLVRTTIWRIYTSLIDDTVHYECWINRDSIDMDAFDLSTIDEDNPKNTFPQYSSYGRSGNIHGDITGTNWRPTTGVMAFPTYYLTRWPGVDYGIFIRYIGVHYSTLT